MDENEQEDDDDVEEDDLDSVEIDYPYDEGEEPMSIHN